MVCAEARGVDLTGLSSRSEENMATKTIPGEIKQQADAIVANFNKTVIQDPENFFVTRYRGLYLYLDRYDYGVLGQRCRLKFDRA